MKNLGGVQQMAPGDAMAIMQRRQMEQNATWE
jgi:hypothetical protein